MNSKCAPRKDFRIKPPSLCFGLVNEVFKLLVSPLDIVVDDDNVMYAWRVCVLELNLGLVQPFGNRLLVLGPSASQAPLEFLEARGLDKDVARFYAALFDLLNSLLFPSF